MKKKLTIGILSLLATVALADTFSLFAPADGLLVGDQDTYVTTSATSTDVRALWAGTCNSSTFLRGDGTCIAPTGTAPAGSNTQVQFNNAGSFGASSALTWNGSTLAATSFTGSGAGLTNVPDSALSSNVPLKDAANVFTASQTINPGNIVLSDGTSTMFIVNNGGAGYFGTSSNHPWNFRTNNTDRGAISAAGNWTINAPGSGNSLVVAGLSGATGIATTAGSGAAAIISAAGNGSCFRAAR